MRSVGSGVRQRAAERAEQDTRGPLGPWAGLGADPAHEAFGAVRFRAEVAGSHSLTPWFTDHAHYYDVGSEALHNMTQIVTGHGDRLAAEGMLAADRAQARIAIPRQVHLPWGRSRCPMSIFRCPSPSTRNGIALGRPSPTGTASRAMEAAIRRTDTR